MVIINYVSEVEIHARMSSRPSNGVPVSVLVFISIQKSNNETHLDKPPISLLYFIKWPIFYLTYTMGGRLTKQ